MKKLLLGLLLSAPLSTLATCDLVLSIDSDFTSSLGELGEGDLQDINSILIGKGFNIIDEEKLIINGKYQRLVIDYRDNNENQMSSMQGRLESNASVFEKIGQFFRQNFSSSQKDQTYNIVQSDVVLIQRDYLGNGRPAFTYQTDKVKYFNKKTTPSKCVSKFVPFVGSKKFIFAEIKKLKKCQNNGQ